MSAEHVQVGLFETHAERPKVDPECILAPAAGSALEYLSPLMPAKLELPSVFIVDTEKSRTKILDRWPGSIVSLYGPSYIPEEAKQELSQINDPIHLIITGRYADACVASTTQGLFKITAPLKQISYHFIRPLIDYRAVNHGYSYDSSDQDTIKNAFNILKLAPNVIIDGRIGENSTTATTTLYFWTTTKSFEQGFKKLISG